MQQQNPKKMMGQEGEAAGADGREHHNVINNPEEHAFILGKRSGIQKNIEKYLDSQVSKKIKLIERNDAK